MPSPSPATPDPRLCPLCGQANLCAMEVARATGQTPEPCWCTQVDFSDAVLIRIPAQARRKACICRACATAQPAGAGA